MGFMHIKGGKLLIGRRILKDIIAVWTDFVLGLTLIPSQVSLLEHSCVLYLQVTLTCDTGLKY